MPQASNDSTLPVIIITGASAGIGAAAAKQLAGKAHLVLVGRSAAIEAVARPLGADYYRADFVNLDSVRRLATQLLKNYPRIDLLVNNAGGIQADIIITKDGHESTFQINYLAQFVLTNMLMERLIASKAGIINTSSAAHLRARLSLDNLEQASSTWIAYANGKLLDVMHARALNHHYQSQGVVAVAFHPGVIATNFASGTRGLFALLYTTPLKHLLKGPDQGADTLVWLVRNRALWQPGAYYVKRKIAATHALARDDDAIEKVWQLTEAL